MTQIELAQQLNYSDKTISKWERGESTPDVAVLVQMADIFGVSLDYLVRADVTDTRKKPRRPEPIYNRKAISYISESCAWIVAVFAFIITSLVTESASFQWLFLVWALPVAVIVKLVFNSIWFNPRNNYLIISALIWSLLAALHITFLQVGINIALIYLLGAAGQVVVVLWSFVRKPKRTEEEQM
ncbi:MAG: helix-turn-helix transcriptional regulator [Clostridia bacterium]|nr:helix-turn-helix transcriptional regulator [Clostridia bacterium]